MKKNIIINIHKLLPTRAIYTILLSFPAIAAGSVLPSSLQINQCSMHSLEDEFLDNTARECYVRIVDFYQKSQHVHTPAEADTLAEEIVQYVAQNGKSMEALKRYGINDMDYLHQSLCRNYPIFNKIIASRKSHNQLNTGIITQKLKEAYRILDEQLIPRDLAKALLPGEIQQIRQLSVSARRNFLNALQDTSDSDALTEKTAITLPVKRYEEAIKLARQYAHSVIKSGISIYIMTHSGDDTMVQLELWTFRRNDGALIRLFFNFDKDAAPQLRAPSHSLLEE